MDEETKRRRESRVKVKSRVRWPQFKWPEVVTWGWWWTEGTCLTEPVHDARPLTSQWTLARGRTAVHLFLCSGHSVMPAPAEVGVGPDNSSHARPSACRLRPSCFVLWLSVEPCLPPWPSANRKNRMTTRQMRGRREILVDELSPAYSRAGWINLQASRNAAATALRRFAVCVLAQSPASVLNSEHYTAAVHRTVEVTAALCVSRFNRDVDNIARSSNCRKYNVFITDQTTAVAAHLMTDTFARGRHVKWSEVLCQFWVVLFYRIRDLDGDEAGRFQEKSRKQRTTVRYFNNF